jgi:hypothetical protein
MDCVLFVFKQNIFLKKISNQKKGNKFFKFCQINIEKFPITKNTLFSNFFINIKYIPSIIIIPTSIKNFLNNIIIYQGNYIYSELLDFIEKYEINDEL